MSQLFTGETDQLRQYVPVNVNFDTDGLMPVLDDTEMTVLGRFIGLDVLEQLRDYASTNDHPDLTASESRQLESALFLARGAVGRIGFAAYLPFAEMQIDNDGITVTAAQGRKAAFEYQTNNLKRTLLDAGWESLDRLLSLLASQPDLFPDWKNAPYYEEQQNAIFKTPAEFSRYYPIQDRWLTFWALRFSIRNVEEDQGADAQARIDKLSAGSVSDSMRAKLNRLMRRGIAYQAVLDALPTLSIELEGINVKVNYGSQYGNADYYQPPSQAQLNFVINNLQRQIDIAWNSFEAAISPLETLPTPDDDSSTSYGPYSTGAISFL
ncbi:DUF6712 family protein [Spirosoma rhododendri]|uniref:Uncharacterized protein n=1 Tax=Spirosoma rhododendri TaxID=2728024 RepID=A0A7L5DUA3_9BACT|nr:DUF6712 family protein [Spirosoma rhododendri]QJD79547.1 hypothetical protein HH216_14845 [Spirosoma rhododendri]